MKQLKCRNPVHPLPFCFAKLLLEERLLFEKDVLVVVLPLLDFEGHLLVRVEATV